MDFTQTIIRSLLPTLDKKLPELNTKLQDYINSHSLLPGEHQATIMCYIYQGETYVSVVALSTSNTITRQITTQPLLPFIKTLLSQIS